MARTHSACIQAEKYEFADAIKKNALDKARWNAEKLGIPPLFFIYTCQ